MPRLQALGWSIVVQPGFAHQSVTVDRWRLVIDRATGEEQGRELIEPIHPPGPKFSADDLREMLAPLV